MSFSIKEAVLEEHDCINKAIENHDSETLYKYADLAAKADDMEQAQKLRVLALNANDFSSANPED